MCELSGYTEPEKGKQNENEKKNWHVLDAFTQNQK